MDSEYLWKEDQAKNSEIVQEDETCDNYHCGHDDANHCFVDRGRRTPSMVDFFQPTGLQAYD